MILCGILFFLYLLMYAQTITLDLFNSMFLTAAIGGSFCLYFDIFLKGFEPFVYWIVWVLFLFIFAIISLLLNLYFLMLLVWLFGSIHIILHILLEPKNQTKIMIMNCCVYISLPLFIIISNYFLKLSGLNNPLVIDEFLMAIDGTLGIYPSLIMGHFFVGLPALMYGFFMGLYVALPTAIILLYIKRIRIVKEPPYSYLIEIILAGVFGYALYNAIPGCGAIPAFNTWPNSLPQHFVQTNPQWMSCPTSFPRNSLPSLHTAWLICLLRQAWFCGRITKIIVSIFAMGTVVAMFGVGHYLIDLIVGFSFANCIGGLCASQLKWQNSARLQATLFGALLCLSWYLIIFHGLSFLQVSKGLAWSAFVGSVFLSLYLELKLFKESKNQFEGYFIEPRTSELTIG